MERISRFAFEYALAYNRNKITVIHKANIQKLGDGLFLQVLWDIYQLLNECCSGGLRNGEERVPADRIPVDDCGQRVHAARQSPSAVQRRHRQA